MAVARPSSSQLKPVIEAAFSTLGYERVRNDQLDVITKFVQGNDVFVSLPTGSGKSLCFACLPIIYDILRGVTCKSIAAVISPLNALMEDQVARFSSRGMSAACVGTQCSAVLAEKIMDRGVQLIYMSPETVLTSPAWREVFRNQQFQENVVCLAVDEAHLIEKWGKKFRTDFAHIGEIRSLVPKSTNLIALTATASISTRKMIIDNLEMHGCYIKSRNPNRCNIQYVVQQKPQNMMEAFQAVISKVSELGKEADRCIIFCRTYNDCSTIHEFLTIELAKLGALVPGGDSGEMFRVCEKFTASSSLKTKKKIIASFTDPHGTIRVVVATVAFGLGLDSPNVRHIIHWGPPDDLELYVQESGRGGRDGKQSTATLLYRKQDLARTSHVTEEMRRYCENMSECRRTKLMRQFTDEALNLPDCSHLCCDICAAVCTCNDCNFEVLDDSPTNTSVLLVRCQFLLTLPLVQLTC